MKIYDVYGISNLTAKEELAGRVMLEENMINEFTRMFYAFFGMTYLRKKESTIKLDDSLVLNGIIKIRTFEFRKVINVDLEILKNEGFFLENIVSGM